MIQHMVDIEWRAIPGWEGIYEASNRGDIRSVLRQVKGRHGLTCYQERLLHPTFSTGYAVVTLVETGVGRRKHYYVHDLILLTFMGPKPAGLEVCHGERGQRDNAVDNLRYDTRSANALDRHSFGLGWPKRTRKPPTLVQCSVCEKPLEVTRRRTAPHRICPSEECRRLWGIETASWRRRK